MPDNSYPGILNMIANGGLIPGRSLGILGDIANGSLNVNNWGAGSPPMSIDNSSVQPGATNVAGTLPYPEPPRPQPVMVKPAITAPTLSNNPNYPTVSQLTNILYNESGSLGNIPGVTPPGQSLDDLRQAQANVALNRIDHGINWDQHGNLTVNGGLAPAQMNPGQMNDMFNQLLAGNSQIYDAWSASLGAALNALSRTAPPPAGPGSATYFNQRPDASTANNPDRPRDPFNSTFGPYRDPHSDAFTRNGQTHWAFFGGTPAGP